MKENRIKTTQIIYNRFNKRTILPLSFAQQHSFYSCAGLGRGMQGYLRMPQAQLNIGIWMGLDDNITTVYMLRL